jgi:hypothetical protein
MRICKAQSSTTITEVKRAKDRKQVTKRLRRRFFFKKKGFTLLLFAIRFELQTTSAEDKSKVNK